MAFEQKGTDVPQVSAHHSEDGTTMKGVKSAALASASAEQKPSPWTKRLFMLYWCLFVATLNSCINGYDGSLMGSINSYRQYREYFGFDPDKGTPGTGIVYAIYTVGNMVGAFFAGPCTDFRGRRVGMLLGAAIIVIGTIVQATCYNLAGFMAGRFLLGFGVSICASAGPVYVSEMAHPAYRGQMTAIYNTFWYIGGIPGAFVPYGTSILEGTQAWRIPVWLQMVFSGLVIVFVMWIPESPRWLIANDRHEEALAAMAKYHGEGDPNSPIVQLEYKEMLEAISQTGSDKRWWDYRELVNSREVRYRSMLVLMMAFFGQWSGNGPVSYYYPQMLQGAGITNNQRQLFLQGMQSLVSFGGAILGALSTDKWGRRPQLLVSTTIIVILFAIITAINATNIAYNPDGSPFAKSSSAARAQIAMIFIFGFVFSAGWTPNQTMYPAECLKFENRAKGMGVYGFFANVASFYNTFATGIAFTNAGWKYYFLFIFWDCFEIACIYFLFVETKKRTLEEITEIFRARNPVKKSLERSDVVVVVGRGEVREVREVVRGKKEEDVSETQPVA